MVRGGRACSLGDMPGGGGGRIFHMTTPNQRSKDLLEAEGFSVALVERYNSWSRTRHDLFGFADLLAVGHGQTLAIQATSDSNVAARRKKLSACEAVPLCLAAGWKIEVHGWAKRGRYWRVRRVQHSQEK